MEFYEGLERESDNDEVDEREGGELNEKSDNDKVNGG